MGELITKKLKTEVEYLEGSGGTFDIHLDGELIYSKHQEGRFPDNDKLVKELKSKTKRSFFG